MYWIFGHYGVFDSFSSILKRLCVMECNDLFDWTKDDWISLESYGFINIMVFNSEVASNTPLFSWPLIYGLVFHPSYS